MGVEQEAMQLLKAVFSWIGRNPLLALRMAREVDRTVSKTLSDFRAAQAEKSKKARQERVDALRGRIACHTAEECLQFLQLLTNEKDDDVRRELILAIETRLKILRSQGP